MAQDLEELLEEYGVDFITSGKNTSADFVNIICDTVGDCAGDTKYKFGIHRSMKYGYCWKCAHGFSIDRITEGLGIPIHEWLETMEEVENEWETVSLSNNYKTPDQEYTGIVIPGEDLHQVHRDYLESRGYDVEFLIKHYHIKGTLFYPDDYKLGYRIVFPITYNNVVISYIARSYVDGQQNKYICADTDKEALFHKALLFNTDKATGDTVIVTEGLLDALKLIQASGNFNVVATYGTSVKPEQLRELRVRYKKVFIIYDNEGPAQEKAEEICTYMQSYGKEAINIKLKGYNDPGELDKQTAKFLVQKLLGE